jgi:hypothetical protein
VSLMLAAAALADFRPRLLAIAAIAAALAANVGPYLTMIPDRASGADGSPTFWQPVIAYLHAHSSPDFRVEVVATANHWETYYLPHAGIPLARGWYRQLDIADDPALYAPVLTPSAYRRWLRQHAVRYVVLPHVSLEAIEARREADVVRSARSRLKTVFRSPEATIYALPRATPLVTGPGAAAIVRLQSSRIVGYADRSGSYDLRVRYDPYWSVTRGLVCLTPGAAGMTRLQVAHPGAFIIQAAETPGAVLDQLFDSKRRGCAS